MTSAETQAELNQLRKEVDDLKRELRQAKSSRGRRRRPPKGRRWNPRWMPKFLRVLRKTGSARAGMRAVANHVRSTRTFYRYSHECKRFKKAWDAARRAHGESSRAGRRNRAVSSSLRRPRSGGDHQAVLAGSLGIRNFKDTG